MIDASYTVKIPLVLLGEHVAIIYEAKGNKSMRKFLCDRFA